jgi:ANTAR domain.
MERFKITSEEAFRLLVTASEHHGLKLRDVAEELAATGQPRLATMPRRPTPGIAR